MPHTPRSIEAKALELIQSAGLAKAPVDLDKVAESLGVKVHTEKLEDDVSGVLLVKGNERHVLINQAQGLRRRRFTIGHEFGHLILHDMSNDRMIVDTHIRVYQRVGEAASGVYDQAGSMTSPQEEREANMFAAALLMPAPWLESAAREHDLEDERAITALARSFLVSEQAMFIRLQHLKVIESTFASDAGRTGRQQSALIEA